MGCFLLFIGLVFAFIHLFQRKYKTYVNYEWPWDWDMWDPKPVDTALEARTEVIREERFEDFSDYFYPSAYFMRQWRRVIPGPSLPDFSSLNDAVEPFHDLEAAVPSKPPSRALSYRSDRASSPHDEQQYSHANEEQEVEEEEKDLSTAEADEDENSLSLASSLGAGELAATSSLPLAASGFNYSPPISTTLSATSSGPPAEIDQSPFFHVRSKPTSKILSSPLDFSSLRSPFSSSSSSSSSSSTTSAASSTSPTTTQQQQQQQLQQHKLGRGKALFVDLEDPELDMPAFPGAS